MQRTNIFHLVHKGLRAALYDTAWKLQQTDFTVDTETQDSLDRIREAVLLIDQHARKLAGSVLPLLDSYEPSVTACIREEQEVISRLATGICTLADQFRFQQTALDKSYAGRQITDAFIEYMVVNLRSMQKEETILHQLMSRYFSPEEIRKIVADVMNSTQPWMQDFYAKWMLRGMNDHETVSWLKAIKREMPGIVFQTMFTKAGQELPRSRFAKLASGLAV